MADSNKERDLGIRITSDPDETHVSMPEAKGARERLRLPLRLLLVSDLTPQAGIEDWAGGPSPARVDRHRFADVMQAMAPRLFLDVPNEISDTPKQLELDLRFPELKAFHPARVAMQVPALAGLARLRALVGAVKAGELDLKAFRARLDGGGFDEKWAATIYDALAASPPAPETPASRLSGGEDSLERLFDLVDLGDGADAESPQPPATLSPDALDALMKAVTGGASAPRVEKDAADALLADLDGMLETQLNAVFTHPAFRRLEAAWRGLKFLVDRLDFRAQIQLEVLAASKDDLNEALYHQVLVPEHEADDDRPPISAVVLDVAFDNGQRDVAQLEDLAETGASLQAPILASVAPAFFGLDRPEELAEVPVLRQHLDGPEYLAWNKLRDRKEARFLALALPDFALRAPYGPDRPAEAFRFEEEGVVWGGGALLVAVAVARSFARTGWPTHFRGEPIEDLPIWKTKRARTPLSALLPESKQKELMQAGFVVLGGRPDRDAVQVTRARTVCRPESYEDLMAATEARLHVTLACQLFVARAAHALLTIQREAVRPGADVAEVKQTVSDGLLAFLNPDVSGAPLPEGTLGIQHVEDAGLPDREVLAVRLQPPPAILERKISLIMGVQVPKPPT